MPTSPSRSKPRRGGDRLRDRLRERLRDRLRERLTLLTGHTVQPGTIPYADHTQWASFAQQTEQTAQQAGEAAGQAGRAVLVVSVALVEARAARVRVGQRASRQRRRCECRRPGCQPRRSRGPMTRYRPGSGAGWQRKGVGRAAPLSRPGRSPSPGSARRASARRSRSGSLRAGWRMPSLRLAAGARNAAGQARESIRHCRTAHPAGDRG